MSEETNKAIALRMAEGSVFRPFLGLLCVIAGLVGFLALYFVTIPESNRDILNLALGIVFGWGSAVVQSEYGATATGRKVAEQAIRTLDANVPNGKEETK